MKIARYIGDLLYDYECVVIPGLGGFLTQDKPASIQPNTHHFRPPYKQVMFNAYLKTNDGLLVNYIAREENISYKEAKLQVDKFVYLCDNALKAGKRIHFHQVGSLYLNKNGKIVFEQDESVNYNAESFGLTGFVSPAVRRITPEEKLREAVSGNTQEKKHMTAREKAKPVKPATTQAVSGQKHARLMATRKKSPYRSQLTFLVLLIIAMMIGWGFMNKDRVNAYYNNYSSMVPLFYSQSNAYVINNIDKVPISKVSSSRFGSWWVHLFQEDESPAQQPANNQPAKKEEVAISKPKATSPATGARKAVPAVRPAKNNVVATPKKAIKATTLKRVYKTPMPKENTPKPRPARSVNVSGRHYYIIAGAFKSPHNVRSLIYKLKKKGYDALAVGTTPAGLHRVAFGEYSNLRQAEQQLRKIRQQENPSAWVLIN